MANQVYSEPSYLHQDPASIILSETRPIRLDPAALLACNYLLDELLHLWIHSAVAGPLSPALNGAVSPTSAAPGPAPALLAPGPLAAGEILTTERFKSGVIRVIGPQLGKNAVLEAELAVRELLRLGAPSLRGDASLRKASFGRHGSVQSSADGILHGQADEMFGSLRAYVQMISGLGDACPPTGPAPVSGHLVALSPPPPAPHPTSPHISFILALYAERCLSYISDYLLRAIGRVVERESRTDAGGLKEMEAAIGEDEAIWVWARGMRVRGYIENELAIRQSRSGGGSSGHGTPIMSPNSLATSGTGTTGSGSNSNGRRGAPSMQSRTSYDSMQSGLTYGKKEREGSMGLGILDAGQSDGFEQLMQSGRTMKVSLTPDRLRTMEKFERNRMGSSTSLSGSTSLPSLTSAGSPGGSSNGSRRLTARGARKQDQIEEDDEVDDFGGRRRPKESLMELLSSPPPWPVGSDAPGKFTSPTAPSPALSMDSPRSRTTSLKRSYHRQDDLASAAMQQQNSQASFQSADSMMSSGSEPGASPRPMQLHMKAKDERKDLAQERQIQYDLQDFFANAPPPLPPLDDIFKEEDDKAATKKKSGSGLRGFMSKVTGGKGREEEEFRHGRKDSASLGRSNGGGGSISRRSPNKNGNLSPQTSQQGLQGKYRDVPSPNSLTVSPPYYSPLEASPPLPPLPPQTPPAPSPLARSLAETPPPLPTPPLRQIVVEPSPVSSPELQQQQSTRPPLRESPKSSRKAVPTLAAAPIPITHVEPDSPQLERLPTPPINQKSPRRSLGASAAAIPVVESTSAPASPPEANETEARPEPVRLGSFSSAGPSMFISPFATDERNRHAAETKRKADEQAAREAEQRELEEQERVAAMERQRLVDEETERQRILAVQEANRLQAEASAAILRTPVLMHTAPTPPDSHKSFSPSSFYATSDAGTPAGSPVVRSPIISSPTMQSPVLAGALHSPTLASPTPQSPDSTYSPSTTYSPIEIAAVTGVAGMGAAAAATYFGHRVGPTETPELPSGLPLSSPDDSEVDSERFPDRDENEKEQDEVIPQHQPRRISSASMSLGTAGDVLTETEGTSDGGATPVVEVLASPIIASTKAASPPQPSTSPKAVAAAPSPIAEAPQEHFVAPSPVVDSTAASDIEGDEEPIELDEQALQTTAPLSIKRAAPPQPTSPVVFATPSSSPVPGSPAFEDHAIPSAPIELPEGATLIDLHSRMKSATTAAECAALLAYFMERQPAVKSPALPASPETTIAGSPSLVPIPALVHTNGVKAPEMHDAAVGSPLPEEPAVETEERGVQSEPTKSASTEAQTESSLADLSVQTSPSLNSSVAEPKEEKSLGLAAAAVALPAALASAAVGLFVGENNGEEHVEAKEVAQDKAVHPDEPATDATPAKAVTAPTPEDDEVASLAEYLLGGGSDHAESAPKQLNRASQESLTSAADVYVDVNGEESQKVDSESA